MLFFFYFSVWRTDWLVGWALGSWKRKENGNENRNRASGWCAGNISFSIRLAEHELMEVSGIILILPSWIHSERQQWFWQWGGVVAPHLQCLTFTLASSWVYVFVCVSPSPLTFLLPRLSVFIQVSLFEMLTNGFMVTFLIHIISTITITTQCDYRTNTPPPPDMHMWI